MIFAFLLLVGDFQLSLGFRFLQLIFLIGDHLGTPCQFGLLLLPYILNALRQLLDTPTAVFFARLFK